MKTTFLFLFISLFSFNLFADRIECTPKTLTVANGFNLKIAMGSSAKLSYIVSAWADCQEGATVMVANRTAFNYAIAAQTSKTFVDILKAAKRRSKTLKLTAYKFTTGDYLIKYIQQ